ncbi:hypothetical protein EJB05_17622, partial [Eragrostis curvula]
MEEYYNHYSSESDDEATSRARSYSVPTKNGGDAGSSSVTANGNGYASSSSAVAAPVLACRICGKEFTSTKAVCGHMKVHALESQWRQEQGNMKTKEKEVKRFAAVERGWGFTGKRGFPRSRCRAVPLNALLNAEPESSTAIVAAEPKLVLCLPCARRHQQKPIFPARTAARSRYTMMPWPLWWHQEPIHPPKLSSTNNKLRHCLRRTKPYPSTSSAPRHRPQERRTRTGTRAASAARGSRRTRRSAAKLPATRTGGSRPRERTYRPTCHAAAAPISRTCAGYAL